MAITNTQKTVIDKLRRFASDDQNDMLDDLLVKAKLMWKCEVKSNDSDYPCEWMNWTENATCTECGAPKKCEMCEAQSVRGVPIGGGGITYACQRCINANNDDPDCEPV